MAKVPSFAVIDLTVSKGLFGEMNLTESAAS